jgi:hypothetical protein
MSALVVSALVSSAPSAARLFFEDDSDDSDALFALFFALLSDCV